MQKRGEYHSKCMQIDKKQTTHHTDKRINDWTLRLFIFYLNKIKEKRINYHV